MSSRSRLVLLVGVIALGAAVFAIFTLLRPDRSDPAPAARAYLADWGKGDWAGMAREVADPPSGFADAHQAVVDDLHVAKASYTLGAVDKAKSGKTAVARFTAKLQLDGLGEWSYGGALSLRHAGGSRWQVDWSPAAIHPDLRDGRHLARTRDVPARAPILDDQGKPLASGRPGRVIGLEPDAIKDLNQIKAAFKAELDIDPAAIDKALHAPGVKPNHFVTITTVDQARYDQVWKEHVLPINGAYQMRP